MEETAGRGGGVVIKKERVRTGFPVDEVERR